MEKERRDSEKITLDAHYFLDMKEIHVESQIGAGGSAKVYKGTYKEIDVAIKRLMLGSNMDMEKAL